MVKTSVPLSSSVSPFLTREYRNQGRQLQKALSLIKYKHFAIDTLLHSIVGQWLQCVDCTCTVRGSGVGCWLLEETKIWIQPPANIICYHDIPRYYVGDIPSVVVNLEKDLIVSKKPVPTTFGVGIQWLYSLELLLNMWNLQ